MAKVTIEGREFDMDALTEEAQAQVKNVSYCDTRLQELQGEIAMVRTARSSYLQALKKHLPKDS
ncbi:MAG: hypothetical protein AAGG09_06150 [Pseudomonadota bacterium]